MNRRQFMTVLGGTSVASLAGINPAFAFAADAPTTTLNLKGLVMVSFEKPVLRIGFPKAPGHKATIQVTPVNGPRRVMPLKGNGVLETKATGTSEPKIVAPELIQMSEFYGKDVKSHFDNCVSVIEIPYAAIRSVTTSAVSKDKWTFVRADNGAEVESFRRRQIAESLKIELSSNSVLKLDGGKSSIALSTTQEITTNYVPDAKAAYDDMFEDHFIHYFENIDRPPAADFLVAPKKLTGGTSQTPKIGNRFIDGNPLCYLVCIIGWLGA